MPFFKIASRLSDIVFTIIKLPFC